MTGEVKFPYGPTTLVGFFFSNDDVMFYLQLFFEVSFISFINSLFICRYIATELASDVVISVGDVKFDLHKVRSQLCLSVYKFIILHLQCVIMYRSMYLVSWTQQLSWLSKQHSSHTYEDSVRSITYEILQLTITRVHYQPILFKPLVVFLKHRASIVLLFYGIKSANRDSH